MIPFQDMYFNKRVVNGHSFLEVQRGKLPGRGLYDSCSSLDNEADGEQISPEGKRLKALDPVGFCKNYRIARNIQVVRNRGFLIAPHGTISKAGHGNGIAGSDIKEILILDLRRRGYHVVGIRADYLWDYVFQKHTNSDFKVHYINDKLAHTTAMSDYLCGKIRANGGHFEGQVPQMTIAQDATAEEDLSLENELDVNLAYGYQALYFNTPEKVMADVKGTLQPIILALPFNCKSLFSLLLSLSIPIAINQMLGCNKGITEELWLMPKVFDSINKKAAGNGLQTGWKHNKIPSLVGELVTDNRAPFVDLNTAVLELKEALSTFGERSELKTKMGRAFGALNGTETRVHLNRQLSQYYFQLRQCLQSVDTITKFLEDDLPEEEDKRTEDHASVMKRLKLATTQVRPLYFALIEIKDIITSIIDGGMEYIRKVLMQIKLPEYAEDGEERALAALYTESMLTDPSKDHDVD
ncbi:phage putative helicase [Salmonella phage SPFM9]|nr:phage putative helicase [Salmonella phage SPFM9]